MTTYFSTLTQADQVLTTQLNGLTSGSYAVGTAVIDNRPTAGSVVSYDDADLYVQLASAVTTGSGAPYATAWILPTYDGSVYPPTSGGAPLGLSRTIQVPASTSTTLLVFPGLGRLIVPAQFKVQLLSVLGVTLPASGNIATLVRKQAGAW